MKRLNDKFMTDEETDDSENGILIRRSPKRHDRLTQLFSKLDKKYRRFSKSEKSRLTLKPRKPGPFTERKPPINAPKWALNDEETSESMGELPDLTNCESESSLTSDDGRAGSTATVTAGPKNNYDTVMVSK